MRTNTICWNWRSETRTRN